MAQRGCLVAVHMMMAASVARVVALTSSSESGETPQMAVLPRSYSLVVIYTGYTYAGLWCCVTNSAYA